MAKENLDLGNMPVAELQAEISRLENEYQQMKFDHAVKGLANPLELRDLRRKIARYHTEIRQREIAEMSADQLDMRSKLRARRRRQR
ncbi:MAG: 50S ribosomal protein L29 [Saprospirales bacterium]|nr:50S ribosomal protein L29 [Saprospirales bacterium]MBK8924036.1 50S ribosomal protein L29 [Saprospirales bacterium]